VTLKFSKKWGEIEVRDFLEEVLYLNLLLGGNYAVSIFVVRERKSSAPTGFEWMQNIKKPTGVLIMFLKIYF